jgi:hypothetical protein
MQPEVAGFCHRHPLGKNATHPRARSDTRLTLSLLLAGGDPAASSLRANHAPERTIERVQLRFLG